MPASGRAQASMLDLNVESGVQQNKKADCDYIVSFK